MAALTEAIGNRKVAADALGIGLKTLSARIVQCDLADWVEYMWPSELGRYSGMTSDVVGISYEGIGKDRIRVYSVRCGIEIHVKRVPAVGVERKRVVCAVCKARREETVPDP